MTGTMDGEGRQPVMPVEGSFGRIADVGESEADGVVAGRELRRHHVYCTIAPCAEVDEISTRHLHQIVAKLFSQSGRGS